MSEVQTKLLDHSSSSQSSTPKIHSLADLHNYLVTKQPRYWIAQNIQRRNLFARSAVFYPFTLEGIFMGVWSSYLPNIQDSLRLTDSQLGVSVLLVYLATVLATPVSAFCIRKLGSRNATLLGKVTFALSLPLIAWANSFELLIPAMFVYGFTMGIMDVCMNSCAILTEIVAGIPLMGSFHGSYSVAAAVGSLLGGAFVAAHYKTINVFLILSACATVLACISSRNMYSFEQEKVINAFNDEQDRLDLVEQIHGGTIRVNSIDGRRLSQDNAHTAANRYLPLHNDAENKYIVSASPCDVETPLLPDELRDGDVDSDAMLARGIPRSTHHISSDNDEKPVTDDDLVQQNAKHSIMFFCIVGFLAAFGESGIVTWSTVYFERYLETTSVTRSLGFTCFMVSMAVGRFCCDYLRRIFGRQIIVRTGGILACGGVLLVVMSLSLPYSIVFACIGFGFAGLGLSTLIPIMFSSAGHLPGAPADTSIAMTAGCSYTGSIISSPLIGFLSDLFGSLRYALLVASLIVGLIFVFGWGIPPEFGVLATRSNRAQSQDEASGNHHIRIHSSGNDSVHHRLRHNAGLTSEPKSADDSTSHLLEKKST